jgi:hypothetical protein
MPIFFFSQDFAYVGWMWGYTPVFPASWETEMSKIVVGRQPGQITHFFNLLFFIWQYWGLSTGPYA